MGGGGKEVRRRRDTVDAFRSVFDDLAQSRHQQQSGGQFGAGGGQRSGRGGSPRRQQQAQGRSRNYRRQQETPVPTMGDMNLSGEELERVMFEEMKSEELKQLNRRMLMEFDPQYAMEDFASNPVLEERMDKPSPSLEEFFEMNKGTLMISNDIKTDEEWKEQVSDVMGTVSAKERLLEMYGGPNQLTAMEENACLEAFLDNLPPTAPPEIVKFTARSILTLQDNPHWPLPIKTQLLKSLVKNLSAHC